MCHARSTARDRGAGGTPGDSSCLSAVKVHFFAITSMRHRDWDRGNYRRRERVAEKERRKREKKERDGGRQTERLRFAPSKRVRLVSVLSLASRVPRATCHVIKWSFLRGRKSVPGRLSASCIIEIGTIMILAVGYVAIKRYFVARLPRCHLYFNRHSRIARPRRRARRRAGQMPL